MSFGLILSAHYPHYLFCSLKSAETQCSLQRRIADAFLFGCAVAVGLFCFEFSLYSPSHSSYQRQLIRRQSVCLCVYVMVFIVKCVCMLGMAVSGELLSCGFPQASRREFRAHLDEVITLKSRYSTLDQVNGYSLSPLTFT